MAWEQRQGMAMWDWRKVGKEERRVSEFWDPIDTDLLPNRTSEVLRNSLKGDRSQHIETDFKKSRGSHTHSHDMDQRCLHPKSYMALQLRLSSSQAKCRTRIFLPLPATSSSRLPADLLSCTSMFIVQPRSQASLASRSNGMGSLQKEISKLWTFTPLCAVLEQFYIWFLHDAIQVCLLSRIGTIDNIVPILSMSVL